MRFVQALRLNTNYIVKDAVCDGTLPWPVALKTLGLIIGENLEAHS